MPIHSTTSLNRDGTLDVLARFYQLDTNRPTLEEETLTEGLLGHMVLRTDFGRGWRFVLGKVHSALSLV